jgi:hypothetical protein
MRLIAAAALCVVLVAAVARSRTPAECGAPAAMSDDWPVSPPAQQGFDSELICATGPGLAKRTEAAPHGVVVVRYGALVYEQYFAGEDMYGYVLPYNANTLHDIGSITKGVVALLIGIAFDRGWLIDLDAPIVSFFPEYADLRTPEKDRITLRHLLAMTSGLDWPERDLFVLQAAPQPLDEDVVQPAPAAVHAGGDCRERGDRVMAARDMRRIRARTDHDEIVPGDLPCTRTRSASPCAAVASAWPVPWARTRTVMPLSLVNSGTMCASRPEFSTEVVEASVRTTNAIERLHEEFKRRIKTQTVLPSAETAAMLFWALLASGQITMRKVDGWQTLTQKLADKPDRLVGAARFAGEYGGTDQDRRGQLPSHHPSVRRSLPTAPGEDGGKFMA